MLANVRSYSIAVFLGAVLNAAPSPPVQLAKPPLSFEPNIGQTRPEVRFSARGRGYVLELTASGSILRALSGSPDAVRLTFVGSSRRPVIAGDGRQPGISNYLIGDSKSWRTHIPNYAGVRNTGLYPNTDLLFHGAGAELEYDCVIRPGGDPSRVRIRIEGDAKMRLDILA